MKLAAVLSELTRPRQLSRKAGDISLPRRVFIQPIRANTGQRPRHLAQVLAEALEEG